MNSTITPVPLSEEIAPKPQSTAIGTNRIESIDIFRGLTVIVMVFVNDLSGAKGLPWWTYHMPENANGMTYVDMVFPAFLFIVGMSIPLAIQRRLAKGQSLGKIWGHILVRSLSLMALGLFIANAENADPKWMGANAGLCTLLAFFGALVLWSTYPASPKYKTLYRTLKFLGLLALLWFAISFRRGGPDGHMAWLDFSYFEILGLIGGAYLVVSTLYLVLRKHLWMLATSLVVLCALNTFSTVGWLKWLTHFPGFDSWPFEAGLSSIAMAGLLLSVMFFAAPFAATWKSKVSLAFGYAGILAAAGLALSRFGISKIRDTPSWCLYCSAINVLLFLVLYWLADVEHHTRWATFARPAGSNTLLAYFCPDVLYVIPGLRSISASGTYGWMGVFWATLFTTVALILCAILTKWKIKLQL
ncbi:MAG: DUF5009 domain-containing protein [Candidatus Korobacteraceae bacterium]